MNFSRKRFFLIGLFLLLGAVVTIGYASLASTLRISGNTSIGANSWIIYFDDLSEQLGSLEASSPAVINSTKDRIDFSISLTEPGDNYTFEVDIVNDGTIDAMIENVSLIGIPDNLSSIVQWDIKYLDGSELRKCDELLAGTRRRIKVIVNYNKDIQVLPASQDLNLKFTVDYVQKDDSVCSSGNPSNPDPSNPDPDDPNPDDPNPDDPVIPEDMKHILTIDPNYGIYEGSDEIITLKMVPGDVYVFGSDPVQVGHTFAGWDVTASEPYNQAMNSITMGDEDITAIAEWTWDEVGDPELHEGSCFSVGNNLYNTFGEAVSSISEEGTIKLLHNGCTISDRAEIPENKNIIFDLNGHIGNLANIIENKGEFEVTDSSLAKRGELHTLDMGNQTQLNNLVGKTMNITGGKYYVSNRNLFINLYNDSNSVIKNSEFYIEQTAWAETISAQAGSTVVIENNKFYANANKDSSSSAVVYGDDELNMTINNNYFEVESKSWNYRVIYFSGSGNNVLNSNVIKGRGVLHGILNNGYIDVNDLIIDLELEVDDDTDLQTPNKTVRGIGSSGSGSFEDVHVVISGNPVGHTDVAGIMNTCNLLKDSSVDIDIESGPVYGVEGGESTIVDSTFNIKSSSGLISALQVGGTITNVEINVENEHLTTYGINGNAIVDNATINILVNGEGGAPIIGAIGVSKFDNSSITIEEYGHYEVTGLSFNDNVSGSATNSTITIKGPNYGRPIKGIVPETATLTDTTYEYIPTN